MKRCMMLALSVVLLASVSPSIGNDQPDTRFSFKPLPPGAVRPEGWLRDWAEAAKNGITGHLDERSRTFGKGWSGESFRAPGVRPHGTGWPLEQCAYWLDGLVRLAYVLDDEMLIEKAKSRLDPIVDGVLDGGESFIYWRPKSVLDNSFNNWAHSHMGRALVAYYKGSGDKRVLDALVKVYRDYPLPAMSPDWPFHETSGAVNLDAMIETYRLSGDAKVLENIKAYANTESFNQLLNHWLENEVMEGHCVIFYESVRVPAMLYSVTGDRRMLDATVRVFQQAHRKHGLPMGITSGEEFLSGIGSTRYTETCNVACGGWTNYWLLRTDGDSRYGDTMEQILFNAGPVTTSRDFQLASYYQSPNRTANVLKPTDGQLPGEDPRACTDTFRPLANGPMCCVGNCNRMLPNYIEHMWMIAPDGSPTAIAYGPCELNTSVNGSPVRITSDTQYPFEESITMVVRAEQKTPFAIGLRIPGWCDAPSCTVNGEVTPLEPDEHGFAWLKRAWGTSDRINLTFPMTPRVVKTHETPFPVIPRGKLASYHVRQLAKRKDLAFPCAYVTYGPLLFALPIADKTPNEAREDAKWNFALDVAPGEAADRIEVVRSEVAKPWNWPLAGPITLIADAMEFDWRPTTMQPLPSKPVADGKAVKIKLVPYGCTLFHISMFPISERMAAAKE